MLRWGRLEVTGGFCLAAAALFYLDTENILPWALLACALHESGHYAVTRLAGGGVAYFRLTAVGGDLGLDPARPLGYAGEMAAILAGPTVNLLCASLCARLGGGGETGLLFAGLNLALGCFNLLPIWPLDGGRLLLLILPGLIPLHWAERTVRGCSALAAGLLLTGGLRLLGDGGGNFTLLPAALWLLAGMLQRRFPKRKGQKSGRKRDFL